MRKNGKSVLPRHVLPKGEAESLVASLRSSLEESLSGDDPRDLYLLEEIFSKYTSGGDAAKLRSVAIDKFLECELQCSLVNDFVDLNSKWTDGNVVLTWHAVVETARRNMLRVLGPDVSWDRVEASCDFGPGASTSLRRVVADRFYKFGNRTPDVTEDCRELAATIIARQPAWFESLTGFEPDWLSPIERLSIVWGMLRVVAGNRVTTVPKSAKTDRVIAIEPDCNMYLQKGLGSVIRSRLRREGIDLNSQEINQNLARRGSLSGEFSTIDFSSASDTISVSLIERLVPPGWLTKLKHTRSPVGTLPDGSVIQYEKFSSMGNGYTFELESAVFWALGRAVLDLCGFRDSLCSIYGDDLILQDGGVLRDAATWAFARAGFTLNERKSFFSGEFRESCGKHWIRGRDVSPIYVRRPPMEIFDLYGIANRLKRWARLPWGLDPRVKPAYDMVLRVIPRHLRVLIPEGLGDIGLIADFDEARPRSDRSWLGYVVRSVHPIMRYREVQGASLLTKWFHVGNTDKSSVRRIPVETRNVRISTELRVMQWPSFGPWLV